MRINARPIYALASGAMLLCNVLCQTANAGLLNISGQAVLADSYGSNSGPETVTIYWSVSESSNAVFTYTYAVSNAVGDVLLDNNGNPTLKPEIVDAFSVAFDPTQPGNYIMNSQTGGLLGLINVYNGLFWVFSPINPGTVSGPLSFQSDLPPVWGNASAMGANPPGPWSSNPNGQQVPVPGTGSGPVVLSSPQIVNGQFVFVGNGLAFSATNVVQACTNLSNPSGWVPVQTNVASGSSQSFTAPFSSQPRFFRLLQLGSACVTPPSGLAFWWRGEDNALDSVGGNNGTLQGGVTYTTGEVGQAFNFDGATGFVSTSLLITNPQTFSLSLWFKTATSDGGVLISFDGSQTGVTNGSPFDRNIYMDDSGTLYFGFWGLTQVNSAPGYNDNHWHQVVGTLSIGTGLSIYVDGVLVQNIAVARGPASYNGYWRIGEDNLNNWPNQPSSYYFQGQIDEVAIFNTAISADDVAAIYNAGSAGMCPP